MAKVATQWKPEYSGTASPDNEGDFLKVSATDFLLIGGTDKLLLGSSVVSVKEPVVWSES